MSSNFYEQYEKLFFIEKPNKYDFSLLIITSIQHHNMVLVVDKCWYNQKYSIYTIPTQFLRYNREEVQHF